MKDFLTHKKEMDEKKRQRIVNKIFRPDGLANADDSFSFEEMSSKIRAAKMQNTPIS